MRLDRELVAVSERLFERHRALASSPAALAVLAAWSFAEAVVWFVIPDFLLARLDEPHVRAIVREALRSRGVVSSSA